MRNTNRKIGKLQLLQKEDMYKLHKKFKKGKTKSKKIVYLQGLLGQYEKP